MYRAAQTEGAEGVSAGPTKAKFEAPAAGAAIGNASQVYPIDRYEAIDLGVISEDRLDAA